VSCHLRVHPIRMASLSPAASPSFFSADHPRSRWCPPPTVGLPQPPPPSIIDDGASLSLTSFYHRRWPSLHLRQPPSPNSKPPPPLFDNVVVPAVLCHYHPPSPLMGRSSRRHHWTGPRSRQAGPRRSWVFPVYLNLASICTRL
jgi:hypothetical protein